MLPSRLRIQQWKKIEVSLETFHCLIFSANGVCQRLPKCMHACMYMPQASYTDSIKKPRRTAQTRLWAQAPFGSAWHPPVWCGSWEHTLYDSMSRKEKGIVLIGTLQPKVVLKLSCWTATTGLARALYMMFNFKSFLSHALVLWHFVTQPQSLIHTLQPAKISMKTVDGPLTPKHIPVTNMRRSHSAKRIKPGFETKVSNVSIPFAKCCKTFLGCEPPISKTTTSHLQNSERPSHTCKSKVWQSNKRDRKSAFVGFSSALRRPRLRKSHHGGPPAQHHCLRASTQFSSHKQITYSSWMRGSVWMIRNQIYAGLGLD